MKTYGCDLVNLTRLVRIHARFGVLEGSLGGRSAPFGCNHLWTLFRLVKKRMCMMDTGHTSLRNSSSSGPWSSSFSAPLPSLNSASSEASSAEELSSSSDADSATSLVELRAGAATFLLVDATEEDQIFIWEV